RRRYHDPIRWHVACNTTSRAPSATEPDRNDGAMNPPGIHPHGCRPPSNETEGERHMKKFTNVRGASMVEYALLLFAVLIVAAIAIKSLGPKVADAGTKGSQQLQ